MIEPMKEEELLDIIDAFSSVEVSIGGLIGLVANKLNEVIEVVNNNQQ